MTLKEYQALIARADGAIAGGEFHEMHLVLLETLQHLSEARATMKYALEQASNNEAYDAAAALADGLGEQFDP